MKGIMVKYFTHTETKTGAKPAHYKVSSIDTKAKCYSTSTLYDKNGEREPVIAAKKYIKDMGLDWTVTVEYEFLALTESLSCIAPIHSRRGFEVAGFYDWLESNNGENRKPLYAIQGFLHSVGFVCSRHSLKENDKNNLQRIFEYFIEINFT